MSIFLCWIDRRLEVTREFPCCDNYGIILDYRGLEVDISSVSLQGATNGPSLHYHLLLGARYHYMVGHIMLGDHLFD